MTKLEAALDAARRGFPVFPLVPNQKVPAIKNWQNLATSDAGQIRQWWQAEPEHNIGITTNGLLVVDIDPRNGGDGTFAYLVSVEGLPFPKSTRSRTQGGGDHVIYRLPEHTVVRGGKDKLGAGVDIKSWGGYVVAPGSSVDGRPYRWGNDQPVAEAPPWLIERCRTPHARSASAGKRVVEEDGRAVEMAETWLLEHAPEAHEGERDDTAFRVAAKLFDFGVSKDTCADMLAHWNFSQCFPPLDADALARLVDSGGRNRSMAIGAAHPSAPGFEAVEVAERARAPAALPTPSSPATRFQSIPAADAAARALTNPSRPLVKGLIDRGTLIVLYGAPGEGKSFIGLDIGYHVGTEQPWAGMKVHGGAVLYVAAEGGEGVFSRLAAMEKHYGRLAGAALHVLPCPVDLLHTPAHAEALLAEIRRLEAVHGKKVELVIVDTVARALAGGDENSGQDMGALIKNLDRIRIAGQCAVMGIHHTGKDRARGARGHSSLLGAVDTEIMIEGKTLTVTKQRDMGKEVSVPFRLRPIRIGLDQDGDEVVSCYVELRQKGEPAEQLPLTGAEQETLDRIDEWLETTTKTIITPKDLYADNDADNGFGDSAVRNHLSALSEKGWIKKEKKGQYVRVIASIVSNGQN